MKMFNIHKHNLEVERVLVTAVTPADGFYNWVWAYRRLRCKCGYSQNKATCERVFD